MAERVTIGKFLGQAVYFVKYTIWLVLFFLRDFLVEEILITECWKNTSIKNVKYYRYS
jgi:hypothetical protein